VSLEKLEFLFLKVVYKKAKITMLETRLNVIYCTNSEEVESPFESLMLHLRLTEINIVSDGRTSVWKSATIEGINIFLEQPSDLEKAAQAVREFFATRTDQLQLRSWQSDGKDVKVIIKGVVNYNENPLPHSRLEYIIE
jgi:hypothetical protein